MTTHLRTTDRLVPGDVVRLTGYPLAEPRTVESVDAALDRLGLGELVVTFRSGDRWRSHRDSDAQLVEAHRALWLLLRAQPGHAIVVSEREIVAAPSDGIIVRTHDLASGLVTYRASLPPAHDRWGVG